jgi:hypothetical protein
MIQEVVILPLWDIGETLYDTGGGDDTDPM